MHWCGLIGGSKLLYLLKRTWKRPARWQIIIKCSERHQFNIFSRWLNFFLSFPPISLSFTWNKRRGKFSSEIDITILRLWTLILIDLRMFWGEVSAIIFIAFSCQSEDQAFDAETFTKFITGNRPKPLMIGH